MRNNNNNNEQFTDSTGATLGQNAQWSAVMSTPIIHENRFSVLTTDDEQNSDGGRFIQQRSARVARAKRRRERSDQQQSVAENANDRQRETSTNQPRRRSVMTGKAHAITSNLAAARKHIKKRFTMLITSARLLMLKS